MNSYGDDDDDDEDTSSSDSEAEILKQFEISVSRSQSFRTMAAKGDEQQSQSAQLTLSRRHKFSRLSDKEEGNTEPSDSEGAEPCQTIQQHTREETHVATIIESE